MPMDRELEGHAHSLGLTDPALPLVAAAREAEAAHVAALTAGEEGPDRADDAIYDALAVIPTTLEGVRGKIEVALEIEGPGWPDDVLTLLRSLLASPALGGSAV